MPARDSPALQRVFAQNLRDARHRMALSQQQLADATGLTTNFIARIETGFRFPSVTVIEKLAAALGVRAYQLFYDGKDAPVLDAQVALKLVDWLRDKLGTEIENTVQQFAAEVSKNTKPGS